MAKENYLEKEALTIWRKLLFQFRLGNGLKLFLFLATALLLIITLSKLFALNYLLFFILLIAVLLIFYLFNKKAVQFSEHNLIDNLNHQYPRLEFSAQLIPASPKTLMQSLQRERILKVLQERHKEIKVWPDLKNNIFVFLAILIPFISLTIFRANESSNLEKPGKESSKVAQIPLVNIEELPEIVSMQIDVAPPNYTGKEMYNPGEPSFEAPEGSKLKFNVQLSDSADTFQVIWGGKDTLKIEPKAENNYDWDHQIISSGFYQFQFKKNQKSFSSPVYTIHAIEDVAPIISIESPAPSTFILYGQQPKIGVKAKISDDYGLKNAKIVATVSRGSGESVKFREEKIDFEEKIYGYRNVKLSRQLLFSDLKMEPGDELYFHIQAQDFANPPQTSRSETYFVQWEDTTASTTAIMDGIAVDKMPAYFRSQRQIIIDTEQLIKEQNSITKEDFKTRANDIGIDQKILRLRYGKFLGEEFETTVVQQNSASHDEDDDHEDEHEGHDHHTEEKESKTSIEQLHDHEHQELGSTVFGSSEGIEQYEHRHDVAEAATFFEEATKAQLKAALAQMWEAELRLRTLRPKEALPFENKALELLKAVQQKNRVYVERVGFEPPPLKPDEKRLTGELNEITNSKRTLEIKDANNLYPNLKKVVAVLEQLHQDNASNISEQNNNIIEAATQEAAALFLEEPGMNPQILSTFHKLLSGEKLKKVEIKELQKQILKILPDESENIVSEKSLENPEFDHFLKYLKEK